MLFVYKRIFQFIINSVQLIIIRILWFSIIKTNLVQHIYMLNIRVKTFFGYFFLKNHSILIIIGFYKLIVIN